MRKFPFWRRPIKLILFTFLLCLFTAAALVFILQYVLDGLTMEYFEDSYAYVGTVYSRLQEKPVLKLLPEEVIHQLQESEKVAQVDFRQTLGARAEGLSYVPDWFIQTEAITQNDFVEGIVKEDSYLETANYGIEEYAPVKLLKVWVGNREIFLNPYLRVTHEKGFSRPMFKKGDHIFFITKYSVWSDDVGSDQLNVQTEGYLESIGVEDSLFGKCAMLFLPDGLSEEESEQYILDYMEETGLAYYVELKNSLVDTFTVRRVSDMSMLLSIADNTTFIAEGRELYRSDTGKKVCVISQALADQNSLCVGDTIRLSLADGCYVTQEPFEANAGWESGYPGEADQEFLEYGEAEDYEIVGLYAWIERDLRNGYFQFSKNDIFIPGTGDPAGPVRPYNFSFRVLGTDYESFLDEFEVPLHEEGYTLQMVDCGWGDIQDSYYIMKSRRGLLLLLGILVLLAAAVLYDVLLVQHFRYEYGLRRMLGAYRREAVEIFVSGFLFTALPAGILAVLSACATYGLWLREKLSEAVPMQLPGLLECTGMLCVWTLAELFIGGVLLAFFVRRMEKDCLLKLIK